MAWDLLICAIGWIIIIFHTWALKHHFDMSETPSGIRVISNLVLLSAVILTFLTLYYPQPLLPQLVGIGLLVMSFAIFWWTIKESKNAKLLAAFDEKLPHGLLTTGPYAYVRHPFYTSYIIQWVGWAIACWSIWGIVPVIFMTTTYYIAAKGEEQKFSNTDMADDYADYASRTGRFFPKLIGNSR